MSSKHNLIKDLIIFYITENYNAYLKENNIDKIQDDKLYGVISNMYDEKKTHLQQFLKETSPDLSVTDFKRISLSI